MYRQFTSSYTPNWIRKALTFYVISQLLLIAFNAFLVGAGSSTAQYLALQSGSLSRGHLWQLLTFPFATTSSTFSFGLIVNLFFDCYLFWMIAGFLHERLGQASITKFFLTSILLTGALVSGGFAIAGYPLFVASTTPLIVCLLCCWSQFYGSNTILLFFVLPLKVRTIFIGYMAFLTLECLSTQNSSLFFVYWTPAICTYLYSLLIWKQHSPFPPLHSFEKNMFKLVDSFKKPSFSSKRYDFKTGKPIATDEEVLDKLLDKMNKQGKSSLTLRERIAFFRAASRLRKKRSKN